MSIVSLVLKKAPYLMTKKQQSEIRQDRMMRCIITNAFACTNYDNLNSEDSMKDYALSIMKRKGMLKGLDKTSIDNMFDVEFDNFRSTECGISKNMFRKFLDYNLKYNIFSVFTHYRSTIPNMHHTAIYKDQFIDTLIKVCFQGKKKLNFDEINDDYCANMRLSVKKYFQGLECADGFDKCADNLNNVFNILTKLKDYITSLPPKYTKYQEKLPRYDELPPR